ncbi:hypothetical protein D9M72_472690 [compost metagenome]
MAGEGSAGHRTVAQHDINEAGRQASADCKLGKVDGRKRRHFGGLQDDGIAGGKRRAELPGGHRNGEIPRRDGADDAIGLGHDHAEIVVVGRHEVAAFLVGEFRKKADLLGADGDIAGDEVSDRAGRGKRLELGEGFRLPFDQVGPALQHDCALARTHAAPVARLQRILGGFDGAVDESFVCKRAAGIGLAVGGTMHVDNALGRDQPVADEVPDGQGKSVGVKAESHSGSSDKLMRGYRKNASSMHRVAMRRRWKITFSVTEQRNLRRLRWAGR